MIRMEPFVVLLISFYSFNSSFKYSNDQHVWWGWCWEWCMRRKKWCGSHKRSSPLLLLMNIIIIMSGWCFFFWKFLLNSLLHIQYSIQMMNPYTKHQEKKERRKAEEYEYFYDFEIISSSSFLSFSRPHAWEVWMGGLDFKRDDDIQLFLSSSFLYSCWWWSLWLFCWEKYLFLTKICVEKFEAGKKRMSSRRMKFFRHQHNDHECISWKIVYDVSCKEFLRVSCCCLHFFLSSDDDSDVVLSDARMMLWINCDSTSWAEFMSLKLFSNYSFHLMNNILKESSPPFFGMMMWCHLIMIYISFHAILLFTKICVTDVRILLTSFWCDTMIHDGWFWNIPIQIQMSYFYCDVL